AALIRLTATAALNFVTGPAPASASADAAALAKGALQPMISLKTSIVLALVLTLALGAAGTLWVLPAAVGEDPQATVVPERSQPAPTKDNPRPQPSEPKKQPGEAKKQQRSCILLWMSGGPSQIDTFDPKPGQANGGPFRAIDTAAKGVRISEHLPRLAKLA